MESIFTVNHDTRVKKSHTATTSTHHTSSKRRIYHSHITAMTPFQLNQLKLYFKLGKPITLIDGTSYWKIRLKWKKHIRRSSLTRWTQHTSEETAEKTHRLQFSKTIKIHLIPPKEGVDFDIDDIEKENCKEYEQLTEPLHSEDEYNEKWEQSPFPKDNGKERPFFYNIYGKGPSMWCLCPKPPRKKDECNISCKKCLNLYLRRFARKSTPEEFTKKYIDSISE